MLKLMISGLTAPTGNCTAGHYCSLAAIDPNPTSKSYGDTCTAGHYCPEGTATAVPCPLGTYLPDTGRSDVSMCLDCPGGKYCAQQGLTNYTGNQTYLCLIISILLGLIFNEREIFLVSDRQSD